MFYCEDCRVLHNLPKQVTKKYCNCSVCDSTRMCHNAIMFFSADLNRGVHSTKAKGKKSEKDAGNRAQRAFSAILVLKEREAKIEDELKRIRAELTAIQGLLAADIDHKEREGQ